MSEPSGDDDGSGGATRKLADSFDEPSSAQQSNKKPFIPMANKIQFEFDEETCGIAHRPIPVILKEGDVVSIPRSEGLQKMETPLFIRQHLVDKLQEVKEEFEDTNMLYAYVTGAPGCGKTCFFWLWAIMKLQKNKRLLFVQHRRKPSVWILESDKLKRVTNPTVLKSNLVDVVAQLLNQRTEKFDFAILDGVRTNEDSSKVLMDMLANLTGPNQQHNIAKSVFVTSLQFDDPLGYECRDNDFNEAVDVPIDSWKESDYDRAVQSKLVLSSVIRQRLLSDWAPLKKNMMGSMHVVLESIEQEKKDEMTVDDKNLLTSSNDSSKANVEADDDDARVKEAVKLKYRYAGGCARFMFAFDFIRLEARLNHILRKCKAADWEELASNSVASGAAASVNSLMQRFAAEGTFFCTPVSEYVLHRAYEVCRSKLTLAVRSAAEKTNNPSLLGWAFEMGELDKLDSALAANCQPATTCWTAIQIDIVPSNTTEEKCRHQVTFCPKFVANYQNGTVLGLDVVRSGTVIRCDIWNQGCFDVAFYMERTLVTLQVTTAKYHSLKLSHVTDLRNAILKRGVPVDDVVHVAILKDANLEGFRFAPATGTGRYLPRIDNKPAYRVKVVKAGELELISVPVGASHTCIVDAEEIVNIYDMGKSV